MKTEADTQLIKAILQDSCEKTDLLCRHCLEKNVERVKGRLPFTEDHWQCTGCDSTYVIYDYPKEGGICVTTRPVKISTT